MSSALHWQEIQSSTPQTGPCTQVAGVTLRSRLGLPWCWAHTTFCGFPTSSGQQQPQQSSMCLPTRFPELGRRGHTREAAPPLPPVPAARATHMVHRFPTCFPPRLTSPHSVRARPVIREGADGPLRGHEPPRKHGDDSLYKYPDTSFLVSRSFRSRFLFHLIFFFPWSLTLILSLRTWNIPACLRAHTGSSLASSTSLDLFPPSPTWHSPAIGFPSV